jgi:hypothetical protein
MVKPKELIKKLDKAGFDKYKDTDNTFYNSQYYQYIISPPEEVNKLVSVLKGETNDVDKKRIDEIRDEIKELSTDKVQEEFHSNINNTMDMLGIEFNIRGSKIRLEYKEDTVPAYIVDLFKTIGKPISPKTGKINMKLGVNHMRDLLLLCRLVGDDLDNE